jgi:hypothetical protein
MANLLLVITDFMVNGFGSGVAKPQAQTVPKGSNRTVAADQIRPKAALHECQKSAMSYLPRNSAP